MIGRCLIKSSSVIQHKAIQDLNKINARLPNKRTLLRTNKNRVSFFVLGFNEEHVT